VRVAIYNYLDTPSGANIVHAVISIAGATMAARARVKCLAAMTVVQKNGVYVGGAGARFFFFFFPTATPIPIACGFLSSYHYRSCPSMFLRVTHISENAR
jgi:hypothetical protein